MIRREFLRVAGAAGVGVGAGAFALLPRETPGQTARRTIDHVIIIFRENHSYDNLFGTFPGGQGARLEKACPDRLPFDPPHRRANALRGATSRGGDCQYREADIPNYFAYARTFTLCDRFFSEILGPSIPNYFMLLAAQTPFLDNPSPEMRGAWEVNPDSRPDLPTLVDHLEAKGLTWRSYSVGALPLLQLFRRLAKSPSLVPWERFQDDARKGSLPAVSWLSPPFELSEHPPFSLCRGENWTVAQVNAVMEGPNWSRSAIFVVYDDWGGFGDHVIPPVVEETQLFGRQPIRYGYRVPCLVISPYARPGYISHALYSHVSILKFCETLFDLPPLTHRDAQANDMMDCFNFTQRPLSSLVLPLRSCPP